MAISWRAARVPVDRAWVWFLIVGALCTAAAAATESVETPAYLVTALGCSLALIVGP